MQETAERKAAQRWAAATRLQKFALRKAEQKRLNLRFAARRARLDFERRNRSELASAMLVLQAPSTSVRDFSGTEDFKAMEDAVRPAVAVARMRSLAASRGMSLEDVSKMSAAATLAAVATADDRTPVDGVLDDRLGGELARAVIEQEKTQRSAAARIQGSWRQMRFRCVLRERFRLRAIEIDQERRDMGSQIIQRSWKKGCLRGEIASRVEKTRARKEAERNAATRRIQKFLRWRRDMKILSGRFAVRKIILEQVCLMMVV